METFAVRLKCTAKTGLAPDKELKQTTSLDSIRGPLEVGALEGEADGTSGDGQKLYVGIDGASGEEEKKVEPLCYLHNRPMVLEAETTTFPRRLYKF